MHPSQSNCEDGMGIYLEKGLALISLSVRTLHTDRLALSAYLPLYPSTHGPGQAKQSVALLTFLSLPGWLFHLHLLGQHLLVNLSVQQINVY